VFISGWSFLNPGCGETGKDTHAFPMKIQGGTGGSEPVRVIANTFIFNCLHCFKAVLDAPSEFEIRFFPLDTRLSGP